MKTFEDFIATKRKVATSEFEEASQQEVEGVCDNVYVYQDFNWIDIYSPKTIGYESQQKSYGLTFCNEYLESNDLRELEIKLYNDWFIDNVGGNDEWMHKVGIHTPKTTPLYYKMFSDMNLDVSDISSGNDLVDTLRVSYGNCVPLCDILLPNSANFDDGEEKFNIFSILFLDKDGEIYDDKGSNEYRYESIDEIEESLMDWFHQIARDYMDDTLVALSIRFPNLFDEMDEPMSLDEFIFKNKQAIGDCGGYTMLDYARGKEILNLHEHFKPLEEWMKFGCEPKNMFDDGVDEEMLIQTYFITLRDDVLAKFKSGEMMEIVDNFGELGQAPYPNTTFDCNDFLVGLDNEQANKVIALFDEFIDETNWNDLSEARGRAWHSDKNLVKEPTSSYKQEMHNVLDEMSGVVYRYKCIVEDLDS